MTHLLLKKRIGATVHVFFFLFLFLVIYALRREPAAAFLWVAANIYFCLLTMFINPMDFFASSTGKQKNKKERKEHPEQNSTDAPNQQPDPLQTTSSPAYREIFSQVRDAYRKGIFSYGLIEDDPVWRRDCRELFLSNLGGPSVIEVGTGPGLDAERLGEEVNLTGVDVSRHMLQLTENRCPEAGLSAASSPWLPFTSNSFDGLFSQFLLLHIPHSFLLNNFREWRRVLKPGGVALFTFVTHENRAEETRTDWLQIPGNHCPLYYQEPYHVKYYVNRAGFSLLMHTRERPKNYHARTHDLTTVHQFLVRGRNE